MMDDRAQCIVKALVEVGPIDHLDDAAREVAAGTFEEVLARLGYRLYPTALIDGHRLAGFRMRIHHLFAELWLFRSDGEPSKAIPLGSYDVLGISRSYALEVKTVLDRIGDRYRVPKLPEERD